MIRVITAIGTSETGIFAPIRTAEGASTRNDTSIPFRKPFILISLTAIR